MKIRIALVGSNQSELDMLLLLSLVETFDLKHDGLVTDHICLPHRDFLKENYEYDVVSLHHIFKLAPHELTTYEKEHIHILKLLGIDDEFHTSSLHCKEAWIARLIQTNARLISCSGDKSHTCVDYFYLQNIPSYNAYHREFIGGVTTLYRKS